MSCRYCRTGSTSPCLPCSALIEAGDLDALSVVAAKAALESVGALNDTEVTAMAAHRVAMEALSALAVRKRDGDGVRF